MRMRQSLHDFEAAFEQQVVIDRARERDLRRKAADRARARRREQSEKQGTIRFGVLVVCLTLTVVIVTWVMFQTLAWLMG